MVQTLKPEAFLNKWLSLTEEAYKHEPHLAFFLEEMKMAFQFSMGKFELHLLGSEEGCIALIKNPRQPEQAVFGFFHVPENHESAGILWKSICDEAHSSGAKKLIGPVQGTTYFPYRFVSESDGSAFFKGEYFSAPGAHAFMMSMGPEQVLNYRSGYRTYFDGIMKVSEPYYREALKEGFRAELHHRIDEELFRKVGGLIDKIFGENWSFSQLSEEELKAVYQRSISQDSRMALYTYYMNDKLIGFCRFDEQDEHCLICKTLGILPEYRKFGLGNAAVYLMHADALKQGYSRMIYALIYDGNRVQQNMPKDDSVIFRKYASYEFKLF